MSSLGAFAVLASRFPDERYAQMEGKAAKLGAGNGSLAAQELRAMVASHRDWIAADDARQTLRARWRALFGEFDVVIAPVSPTPALPHDHRPESERKLIVDGRAQNYFANAHWSGVATLAGLPATALPIGRTPQGLPIGAQIIGPWLEDRTPIALAKLIEREFGGFSPPPL